jgi:CxxC motif-containing protein (DUF1111 family)
MRLARPLVVVTPIVTAIVLCLTTGRTSAHGSFFELGRPLDGINLQQRAQFRDGKAAFEEVETAADGLGPIFNNTGCAVCHSTPVTGGGSAINETRAQKLVNGQLFEFPGGSLFQTQAISPNCAETLPPDANVIALRQTTPLFGLGLVEAIPDSDIEAYAFQQARQHPHQAGRVNRVTDVASGQNRVGRFGWKDQQATLLSFSGDAYVNEMGVTNKFFPTENAPNGDLTKLKACDTVPDPEDKNDDVTLFANFMRLLAPPPRDPSLAVASNSADSAGTSSMADRFSSFFGRGGHDPSPDLTGPAGGEKIFDQIGCAVCHHAGFVARSHIDAINGQPVNAYSDFLLHDVGTGDGIAQGTARPNELRTPPLWGLSDSAPYLHDGSAATVRDAIKRHGNQGAAARAAFEALSWHQQQAVLDFLDAI